MSSAVVIGSGLGGLLCGSILARHGYKVTVLERGAQMGGCLQSFVRGGIRFDTGFHSVAGLAPGEPLYRVFEPLDLMRLPWRKVSTPDQVVVDGITHSLPRPADIPALARLKPLAYYIGTEFPEEASSSAAEWLKTAGLDPRILLGVTLRLQSPLSEVSLHEYAHIAYHFMNGSWRLDGGGQVLAKAIADDIRSRGGEVLTRKEVVRISPSDDGPCQVLCADGSTYQGIVVSDIHPLETAALVRPSLRSSYLKRLSILRNGSGIFTTYIKLKQKQIRYVDHAISIDGMLVHFGNADKEGYAISLDLMTHVEKEIPDRESFARACISRASACIEGLENAVEEFWTSTPDTWQRYTGTPGGSAYGILKQQSQLSVCVVSPRTPLPGLYLTGQNLGLHGVLGVSYTAVRTCSVILGAEKINQMFNFAQ